jgi:putative SOS response-associated peptidase YedK
MCGRYTVNVEGQPLHDALQERFMTAETTPEVRPTFNAAPTQTLPVVIEEAGSRRIEPMCWCLIPRWQKPGHRAPIAHNARSEEVETKPAFQHLLGRHRCLVPASGFYEWQSTEGKARQPFYFSLRDEPPFAFAELWDEWRNRDLPDEPPWRSFTILTNGANTAVSPDYPDKEMQRWPVSRRVNSARENGPDLILNSE